MKRLKECMSVLSSDGRDLNVTSESNQSSVNIPQRLDHRFHMKFVCAMKITVHVGLMWVEKNENVASQLHSLICGEKEIFLCHCLMS